MYKGRNRRRRELYDLGEQAPLSKRAELQFLGTEYSLRLVLLNKTDAVFIVK